MDAVDFADLWLGSMTKRRFEPLCFGRRDGFDFFFSIKAGKLN